MIAPKPPRPPIRPGSPRYRQLMQLHEAFVSQYGVRLTASPQLIEDATRYGTAVHRCASRPHEPDRNEHGQLWVPLNTEGQIAAELFANYFGAHADWTVYDQRDPGWDVRLWGSTGWVHVDVKAREGWLLIPEKDGQLQLSQTADYVALVDSRWLLQQVYVLVGVLTPRAFRAAMERSDFGQGPCWSVETPQLLPLRQFASRLQIRVSA